MKNDNKRIRFLIEENKELLEELKNLQIRFVQEKLFGEKNRDDAIIEREILLDQKIDVLIRFLITGDTPGGKKSASSKNDLPGQIAFGELEKNDFASLIKEFNKSGFYGAENFLENSKITGALAADSWSALSEHLSAENIEMAAEASWKAWLSEPLPERLKNLAFRMYEAGEVFFADLLLRMFPRNLPLGESELRKKEFIHKRMLKRLEYLRGLDELERSDISTLRKNNMRLLKENERVKTLEKEKQNLLFMIKIKDDYLEKVNKENDNYKNLLKELKGYFSVINSRMENEGNGKFNA